MISQLLRLADTAVAKLNAVPYAALALIARAAAFTVFWRAGTQKLDDWQSTLSLFANEYHVPILPPELAAKMAATMEIGGSTLILLGLFTRPAVLMLLGMVSVIQIFVYPTAWPDHIQWLAFMAFLLARGPGAISLDHLLGRLLRRNSAAPMLA
jgi:putative oxidoreductase